MYRKYVAIYHAEGRHSPYRAAVEAALFIGYTVIFQLMNYMDQGSFQKYMEKIMQVEANTKEKLLYYSHV